MRPEIVPLFWLAVTLVSYCLSRWIDARLHQWWTSPLLLTFGFCLTLALVLHASYHDYLSGTFWLGTLLGPATVAFALPIYEKREMIRRYWPTLAVGVVAGSTISIISSLLLAHWLGLAPDVRLSLVPRSITTPFAMAVSGGIGGIPGLTATCVILTGLCGGAVGELLLKWLPLRSSFSRGALFGMGAHGCGAAKAREVGVEEGSIAGLVMVLAGLANVAFAPVLAILLR
ncbi:MAG: LrgB family protein [Azospirillaceae bacterium]|nr:LrgB family protein [Azospirillaceae bacterium]